MRSTKDFIFIASKFQMNFKALVFKPWTPTMLIMLQFSFIGQCCMRCRHQTLAYPIQEAPISLIFLESIWFQRGFVYVLRCWKITMVLKWSILLGWLLDWVTPEISTTVQGTM
jgi:hypothetical protein